MKIGAYVCECGVNIAATVDVEGVVERTRSLPNVAVSRFYKYMCSDPGQQLIRKDIKELGLDRVVVASCSPRMHEPTFRKVLEETGMNPYCLEMVNIREQCSWVHDDRKRATEKAGALIAGAVARAALLEPLERKEVGVTPKALVIGGGIAGIQAALEIADKGFHVYLVEQSPSLGGRMAQLDKTFPTLDCSACILTPKMVDAARHPNIEIHTYSKVVDVKGYIGNFKVKVKEKPRYVDIDKCTGCGECVVACPVEVPNEFDMKLGTRKAIYVPFPQAVPLKYTIEKSDAVSPCRADCPAGLNAQGYIALISRGKFQEALDLARETLPFPSICGRVCHHPCELNCNRKEVDEPVAIRALKRFVADWCKTYGEKEVTPLNPTKDKKVAIVGAGPAGLACARDLITMGYPVTVFDEEMLLGGMITNCIPGYRIPKEVAEYDINRIIQLGLNFRGNVKIGRDKTVDELRKEYDAIFIAIGAQKSRRLDLGTTTKGVLDGIYFLKEVKKGRRDEFGKRVLVVGGGNVAIDCAKTSLRLGTDDVSIVYRRSRKEMPAYPWEIEEAEEEGVKIHYQVAPTKILYKDGNVVGMECIRFELGAPDESGRRRPLPVKGSEFTLEGDTVIVAIGQDMDLKGFESLEATSDGTIMVDPISLETSIPGIFAGGDVVRGPASVVEAIADGKEAAISVGRYLSGMDLRKGRQKEKLEKAPLPEREFKKIARYKILKETAEERRKDFREIELCFTSKDEAIEEAKRCLNCAVCSECDECVRTCSELKAVNHEMVEKEIEIDVGTIVVATGFDLFDPNAKPEYGYGKYPNVITGLEFERLSSASGPTGGHIEINGRTPEEVVFIQCVGSRDRGGNEYCSRVCCMYTAKQAHLVREKLPDARVTIFYTDVRAFGKGFEEFYNRVQSEGVTYRRRELDDPIEVTGKGGKVIVRAKGYPDAVADLVVLATAIIPRQDAKDLARVLNINESADGFLLEAHPKLRPIDTFTDGVFLAGCCQSPKDIPDTVAQASAAAVRAAVPLSHGKIKVEAISATIEEDLCGGCRICEGLCSYAALEFDSGKKVMKINDVTCKGCGACSSACPTGAISMKHFSNRQILVQIREMMV